jgi:RNA polymerase sigma factor (sigma-70 family)
METSVTALIDSDERFQQRTQPMQRCELEQQLEQLHGDNWGWALSCCGRDRELAEDVLQSAYLRILSRPTTFAGESSLRTWVFGVIRLTAREQMRKQWFWNRRSADATMGIGVIDSRTGADEEVEASERRSELLRALSTLSSRQKEVLQLVFYHDMTIGEAAKIMRVSLGAARTHYERGKKSLARTLQGRREA